MQAANDNRLATRINMRLPYLSTFSIEEQNIAQWENYLRREGQWGMDYYRNDNWIRQGVVDRKDYRNENDWDYWNPVTDNETDPYVPAREDPPFRPDYSGIEDLIYNNHFRLLTNNHLIQDFDETNEDFTSHLRLLQQEVDGERFQNREPIVILDDEDIILDDHSDDEDEDDFDNEGAAYISEDDFEVPLPRKRTRTN